MCRAPTKVPFPQPGVREDFSHAPEKLYEIRQSNTVLLGKLERIQRKGGETQTHQAVVAHTAASGINRRKKLTAIEMENLVRMGTGRGSGIAKQLGV